MVDLKSAYGVLLDASKPAQPEQIMRAKIRSLLLAKTRPTHKPYEIYDTDLKGFTMRVQLRLSVIVTLR